MRRKRHAKPLSEETELDMTPMLDVVFILLIFFIVTASFVKESGLTIQRPTASSTTQIEHSHIFVAIDSSGEIWVDKRNIDIRSLRAIIERLHSENPEGAVIIQADAASRTDQLVRAMDQIRLAGVENIAISADTESLAGNR